MTRAPVETMVVDALPDDDRDLLRRAAVLRRITRPLATLATGSAERADRVIADPLVRGGRQGRGDEVWAIAEPLRRALLDGWPDADAVRALVADGPDAMEARYARLSADGSRGAAVVDLRDEFARAIEGDDVPLAHDLLRLLDEWPIAGDPEVAHLTRELRPRLRRHSRALRDREATRGYFVRDFEQPLWDTVVAGGPRWMLHLHAPGGRGKTMFTRNLLGRWCPEHDVPAARIDFDYVTQVAVTTAEPWRLLLAVATQLDPQLPDSPFESLLATYGELDAAARPEALPPLRPGEQSDRTHPVDELAVDAAVNLPWTFASALRVAVGREPVVIVLDTIENVLHTPGADLGPALDAFGEIVEQAAPGLRVVLSGRFDVTADREGAEARERVQHFRDRWVGADEEEVCFGSAAGRVGAAVTWIELPDFSPHDSREFLGQRWGLTDTAITTAIAGKADGNPMKLTLLAEYAVRTPGVTVADVVAIEEVDLFYLVDRVVDRIADTTVQWLLRWGALLPVLTRDAVERVLWPALDAFAEHSELRYDDASTDPVTAAPAHGSRWPVPRLSDVRRPGAVAAAWDGLLEYVADASWVSPVEGLPDAVAFHGEVRDPLRRLLRRGGRPVHDDIHRRAFAYWLPLADRAASAPERRAAHCAALFHAYQPWSGDHDGDGLFARFTERAGEDRDQRAALAGEVVAAAARLGEEAPSAGPSGETVSLAHLELAESLVADSVRRGTPVQDFALSRHLVLAEHGTDRYRIEFLEAVYADLLGRPAEAWSHVAEALGHRPRDVSDRHHLALIAAWAATRTPPVNTLGTAQRLDQICAGLPFAASAAAALARGLVLAERWTEAVDAADRSGDVDLLGAALLGRGEPERVLADGSSTREWRARAWLLLRDPERALRELGERTRAKSTDAPPPPRELHLRGSALAQLDRFDEAFSDLSQAAAADDTAVAAAAGMELAETSRRVGQDGSAISYLTRLAAASDPLVAIRAMLLSALGDRDGDARLAAERLADAEARAGAEPWLPPSVRVALAVTRLAVDGEAAGATPSELIGALVAVDGERARLAALRHLTEVPGAVAGFTPSHADGLRTLTRPNPSCPPALLLARAELERVLGDEDTALAVLDRVRHAASTECLERAVDEARDRLSAGPGPDGVIARAPSAPEPVTEKAGPQRTVSVLVLKAQERADGVYWLTVSLPGDGLEHAVETGWRADLGLALLDELTRSTRFQAQLAAVRDEFPGRPIGLLCHDEPAARVPWEALTVTSRELPANTTFVRVADVGTRPSVAPDAGGDVAAEGVHVVVLDPRRDRGTVPDLIRRSYDGRVPVSFSHTEIDPATSTASGDSWPGGHVLHVVAAPLERRRAPGLQMASGALLTPETMLTLLGPAPRLVVLDLALAGSDDEVERQLMSVNAFCWHLAAHDPDYDVLCGVFAGANDGTSRLLQLVEHLVADRPLGKIAADLQRSLPVLPGGRSTLRDVVSLNTVSPDRRYLLRRSP